MNYLQIHFLLLHNPHGMSDHERPHGGVTLPLTGQHQRPVEAHDFRQTEHVARHRFQKVLSFLARNTTVLFPIREYC